MRTAKFCPDAPSKSSGCMLVSTAFQIARDFAGSSPTVQALRERYGMSRATAFRYVRAWRAVHPAPPEVEPQMWPTLADVGLDA
jgi:hypothetical protein